MIKRKVGKVAYELHLLTGSSIHPVVHVSQFKKKVGQGFVPSPLPIIDEGSKKLIIPVAVLEKRFLTRRNKDGLKWLVQWLG